MRGRVSKSRARRSRLRPSEAQENRQDVPASKIRIPELSQSHRDRSSVGGVFVQDTTPSKDIKRPLCPASTNDCSPAKRARLTQTEIQRRPSRRSARLQGLQAPGSLGSIRPSGALSGRQIEAHDGTSTSERPGLTRRNTQLGAKTEQQPDPSKRTSTTPPEVRIGGRERTSPTTPLQKRQRDGDGDGDGDSEHQLKRAHLTHKNLTKFNEMARKEGTSKASLPAPPESTAESTSTKTTSTTTSGFAIQAYENSILLPSQSKPPTNHEEIRKRYAESRGTASPTESAFEDYVDTIQKVGNEATMVFEVGGKLLKEYPREGYARVFNRAFTGFPKDVGFNNGLSAPQPDFIEGLRMEEYRPFPVHKHVDGAVLYKDDPFSVTLPHFAGEWKASGKDMKEATLQSAYDGAALVYARNQALAYLGKSDPPGHAEVTTFTTDGTNLNLYAHYATLTEDKTLEYHQCPITSVNLLKSRQEHNEGRKGLRNEQDYAKKQSCALRDQLKEHWKQHRETHPPNVEGPPRPVADDAFEETSGDGAGYVAVEQPCQPTPAASSSVSSSSGQKRKASSSRRPSHDSSRPRAKTKTQEYWKWDAKSGNYYHRHSGGKVTWLEDSDDGN